MAKLLIINILILESVELVQYEQKEAEIEQDHWQRSSNVMFDIESKDLTLVSCLGTHTGQIIVDA